MPSFFFQPTYLVQMTKTSSALQSSQLCLCFLHAEGTSGLFLSLLVSSSCTITISGHLQEYIPKCHHNQSSCTFPTLFSVAAPFEVSHLITTALHACVVSAFSMSSPDFTSLIESVLVCLQFPCHLLQLIFFKDAVCFVRKSSIILHLFCINFISQASVSSLYRDNSSTSSITDLASFEASITSWLKSRTLGRKLILVLFWRTDASAWLCVQ